MGIDPTVKNCSCGYRFKPSWWMKIMMLLHGHYVHTCPQCQSNLELQLIHHVVVVKRTPNLDKEIYKRG